MLFEELKTFLSGPHSGALCQIMDIFVGRQGKLNINTSLLSVHLVYGEKLKLCKNIFLQSYEKKSELIEHHSVLQFLKTMSNINTKKSTKSWRFALDWLILQ